MSANPVHYGETIIIVGAGVFGLTTALELHSRGYHDITVVDRYLPPVPDGSSVDISRIIRPDYADPFYARMGVEAMEGWNGAFASYFYRSGLLCVSQTKDHPYLIESKRNLSNMGLSVFDHTGDSIRQKWTGISGDVSGLDGYYNEICGWADAKSSIEHLAKRCSEAGICFISGSRGTVTSLITTDKKVVGIRTTSSRSIFGDKIILATGSWTPYLVDMTLTSLSTGQPVGFLQLSPDEAHAMRSCPVILDLSTGWFCFPPTPDTNILKVARHGYGYESRHDSSGGVSAPMLKHNNAANSFIPEDAVNALRSGLKTFFPQFHKRDFIRRRLCWYTDTATGDFVVDYHPEYKNLFLACGGSGHAFKFLPVLGRYVADAFEGRACAEQQKRWAWRQDMTVGFKGDGSRGGPSRRVLSRDEQARL